MKPKTSLKTALEIAGTIMFGLQSNNCAPILAQKQAIVETSIDNQMDQRQTELRQMMEYYLSHQQITLDTNGQITIILCQTGPDAENLIDEEINQFVEPMIFEKCPYGTPEIPGETLKLKEDCEKSYEENCATCVEINIDTSQIKCHQVPELPPSQDNKFPDMEENIWYYEYLSIEARLKQLEDNYTFP